MNAGVVDKDFAHRMRVKQTMCAPVTAQLQEFVEMLAAESNRIAANSRIVSLTRSSYDAT
jgi:hypothetical protein